MAHNSWTSLNAFVRHICHEHQDPTPLKLLEMLLPAHSEATLHQEGYVEIVSQGRTLATWIDEFGGTIRFRAVLVPWADFSILSNENGEKLAAHLNATFQFGRFNSNNPIGLLLDYELPFVEGLVLGVISSAVNKLATTAKTARENHIETVLARARARRRA